MVEYTSKCPALTVSNAFPSSRRIVVTYFARKLSAYISVAISTAGNGFPARTRARSLAAGPAACVAGEASSAPRWSFACLASTLPNGRDNVTARSRTHTCRPVTLSQRATLECDLSLDGSPQPASTVPRGTMAKPVRRFAQSGSRWRFSRSPRFRELGSPKLPKDGPNSTNSPEPYRRRSPPGRGDLLDGRMDEV
jgi:hypothetical protein